MQILIKLFILLLPTLVLAWPNGPNGNAQTDKDEECNSPPYSTHDFVADHGLMMLPETERAWIMPFRTLYLLGTEAPDNDDIPLNCGAPNQGYDDRRKGHSVEWNANYSAFAEIDGDLKDRAAKRAQEEYDKAVQAFKEGKLNHAAFYLGAMAHYIGDTSQFGHSVPFEENHSNYETWSKSRAASFDDEDLSTYMILDNLTKRTAYEAVKRVSRATAGGKGKILHAMKMDAKYGTGERDQEFTDSFGNSINLGANEIADVLHTFYRQVVANEGDN